jgi:hypothetical protein
MCPPRTPARGSGSIAPNRAGERASTTCSVPESTMARMAARSRQRAASGRGVNTAAVGAGTSVVTGWPSRTHLGSPPSSTATRS